MRVIIDFPDHEYEFYIGLFKKLGSGNIIFEDLVNGSLISDEHKAITLRRINDSKKEELLDWDDALASIKFE